MILTITLNTSIDKRLVMECIKPGEVNRVRECYYTPGGKGLNVSRVLHTLKMPVLAGGIAGGHAGRYIEEELNKIPIENAFYSVKGESRSCINLWDEQKKQQTEYLEPGFTLSAAELNGFKKLYQRQLLSAQVITLSGSVPRGVDNSIYKILIEMAKSYGCKIILDTSGELLQKGIEAGPTLIKPNIDEIRVLTGKKCDTMEMIADAASTIQQAGIPYVAISLGDKGALLAEEGGIHQAIIPSIRTVNTVGCGDAMVAGFAVALRKGMSAEEMLKYSASVATASAFSEGTGCLNEKDRREIYEQIEIIRL